MDSTPEKKSRILIIASAAPSLVLFRGDLIKALIGRGYEVIAASGEMDEEFSVRLREIGATPLEINLSRTGMNPFKDLRSIWQLKRLIRELEIDLLFPYTIKPVIYGSLAAGMVGIPVVSMITGLGFTFSGGSTKARILQQITQVLYKRALRKNRIVIFQNPDDRDLFLEKGLISRQQRTAVVNGSGVNFERFRYRVREREGNRVVFVLVARLIREKGVQFYMDAAEQLKPQFPEAEFHIIGEPDETLSAIRRDVLEDYHERGIIVFHGFQRNVPERLYESDVFVLPTYYREGIPRSILEALSIGMPIITTDTPGCRQTIVDNKNGILIPPKDQSALYEAMKFLLDHPEEIKPMGIASRKLAEETFDVRLINRDLMQLIESV